MNLEEFFIKEYESLKEENRVLQEELESLRADRNGFGVFVRELSSQAVKVDVKSSYDLFKSSWSQSNIKNYKAESLRRLLREGNAKKYIDLELITVDRRTFDAVLEARNLTGTGYYFFGGSLGDSKLEFITSRAQPEWPCEIGHDEMCEGVWMPKEYEDELLEIAVDTLVSRIDDRIEELEREEQKKKEQEEKEEE